MLYMKPDSTGAAEIVSKGDPCCCVRLESGSRITVTMGIQDEHGVEKVFDCPRRSRRCFRTSGSASASSYDPQHDLDLDRRGLRLGRVAGQPKVEHRRLAIDKDASLTVGGFSGLLDDFTFAGVHSTDADPRAQRREARRQGPVRHPLRRRASGLLGCSGPRESRWTTTVAATILEIATNGMLSVSYGVSGGGAASREGGSRPGPAPPKKE